MAHLYARTADPVETPQSQPLPRRKDQVKNRAGGYVFKLDPWQFLTRFLVLGTAGGTYYATEREFTQEAIDAVLTLVAQDGPRVVRETVEVSKSGRAPRNTPALFALAACSVLGDAATKAAANAALPEVARIGTHLFQWAESVKALSGEPPGNGAGQRRAIARWYNRLDYPTLCYQLAKYRQREGWSHRDLLRLAHVVPASPLHDRAFKWAVGKLAADATAPDGLSSPDLLAAFAEAQATDSEARLCELVREARLSWEMLPSAWLAKLAVWDALLGHMPVGAMVRNLGRMGAIGLLAPLSAASKLVSERLRDSERIRKARLHPVVVLNALKVYGEGHGLRGSLSWQPVPAVVEALEAAFDLAFGAIVPTGKRVYLAIDASGSMTGGNCIGLDALRPVDAAAAMALVTARTERDYHVAGFDDEVRDLGLTARTALSDVVRKLGHGGGTDASLPFEDALRQRMQVDAFIVYTDCETWAGRHHPVMALKRYRDATGIAAKLVVAAVTATQYTIADPLDPSQLDVVGFDAAAPKVISDHVRGEAAGTAEEEAA